MLVINDKECKEKIEHKKIREVGNIAIKTKNIERMIKTDRYRRKDIKPFLNERKEYLEKLIAEKDKSLKDMPQGLIRVNQTQNGFQYFVIDKKSSGNGRYIPQNKIDLAKKLSQKSYNKKVRDKAKLELGIVSSYIDHLEDSQLFDIYTKLSVGRRELIKPVSLTDEQYIAWWKSVQYEPYVIEDKDNFFYTNGGIRVRSKSELMIGNALERFGIPYRYEFPLVLWNNDNVRPDFYCLNVRERTEKVWEHFGKMDDPGYANRNVKKIMDYEQTGFRQGMNFTMTFETSKVALNSKMIDEIIEMYLI